MRCSKCGMDNSDIFNFCVSCGAKLENNTICQNCQTENENNSKYCKNCGMKLDNFNITGDVNTPGVRKSIKRSARAKKKSSIILTYLTMFVIGIILFLMVIGESTISSVNVAFAWFMVIIIVAYIISIYVVKFGISVASIELARGNNVTVSDTLTYGFHNIIGLVRTVIINMLFTIIVSIAGFIPFIGSIITIAAIIYMAPVLTVFGYLQADNKQGDITFIDSLKRSIDLCNGKRTAFYGLIMSFIGWYLLGFVTLGIAFIWVIPYVNISLANYYRMLIGEENFANAETGMSNAAIISLCALAYVLAIILFFVSIIIAAFALNIMPIDDEYPKFIEEYYERI